MQSQAQFRQKITNAQTVHAATGSRYVKQIVITCTTAGQTLKIQEAGGTGMILMAAFSPTVATDGHSLKETYDPPVLMSTIDIVTTATGTSHVWIGYGGESA